MTDSSENLAITQSIDIARAHHRAGRLAHAEAIDQQVLQAAPELRTPCIYKARSQLGLPRIRGT